jgi:hypothetical protein
MVNEWLAMVSNVDSNGWTMVINGEQQTQKPTSTQSGHISALKYKHLPLSPVNLISSR